LPVGLADFGSLVGEFTWATETSTARGVKLCDFGL
jgi:hypothetical protein